MRGFLLLGLLAACDPGPAPGPDDGGADGGGCLSDVQPSDGVVVTDRGAVRGLRSASGGSWAYLGIPFAQPPTGALRWRPPEPPACWSGARDALAFPNKCPQLDGQQAIGDEGCLGLNVWAPDGAAPKPVLVFIHGGGNGIGSSSEGAAGVNYYDGHLLAEKGGVVVVTVQYRLGVLGFLTHPALDAEGGGASGNYGLLDQQAALAWVKRNAAAFGGDPARLLVFGESAGAVNTCMHLVAPGSAGLFSAALMQSGGCPATPLAQAEQDHATAPALAGCGGAADVLACLRGVAPLELVAKVPAQVSVTGLDGSGLKFGPVTDGRVIPEAPMVALAAGRHNRVPFVVGANSDETSRSVPSIPDAMTYERIVRQQFGLVADLVLAEYPASAFATPLQAYVQLTTDARFVCPARKVARAADAGQPEPVYRYFFTHALDAGMARAFGAWHGLEILFVFAHLEVAGYVPSPAERALSDQMIGYWTRLAAGDPNGASAPAWPVYDSALDSHLVLDNTITAANGVRTDRCDFWDRLFP
jgi:para-nitrobenzyl esterase